MASINHALRRLVAKIVYCGPGLSGKTTNIDWIYHHTHSHSRGEGVSLETETDRTLFFDLLPLDLGTVAGYRVTVHLFTVPGVIFYGAQRELVLTGTDGLVFVADSQKPMIPANRESLKMVRNHLARHGIQLDALPAVLQCNKRDLPDIVPVSEIQAGLGCESWPCHEAIALKGVGVSETLTTILTLTMRRLKRAVLASSPPVAPSLITPRIDMPGGTEWIKVPTWLAAEPGNPFDWLAGL